MGSASSQIAATLIASSQIFSQQSGEAERDLLSELEETEAQLNLMGMDGVGSREWSAVEERSAVETS